MVIRVRLPDGTFKDFSSKAEAHKFIAEMKDAYDGYLK